MPGGSTTRWNFKSRAVHAVHEGRGSLITALDRITTEPGWDKDAIAQSSALRQKLDDFDFMFMLEVFKTIFGLTEPLFQVLQSRALDIRKCEERVNGTLNALKATRSTETFNQLNEETVQAVGMPNQLRHKHRRRAWADFELGVNPDGEHEDTGPVDTYRRLFFQLLDGIVQHMTHRFEDISV